MFGPLVFQSGVLGALVAIAVLLLAPKLGGPPPTWIRFPLAGAIGGGSFIILAAVFIGGQASFPLPLIMAAAVIGAIVGLIWAGIWARNSRPKKSAD